MTEPEVPSAAAGGIPPEGVLEELDGTPISPPVAGSADAGTADPALPWRRGVAAAVAATAGRPRLWMYALVAFLARGGLVVLALPIIVLPTFIGIANVVGPASVSAGGPSPRLVALIVAGVAAVTALVLVGTIVAAVAETALHRSTVAPDPDGVPGEGDPDASFMVLAPRPGAAHAVARVVALRLLLVLPVAAVTAVAIPAWISAAYRELTLPSDVAAPLLLRVLAGAPAASLAVLLAWLVAEIVGGFATRRAVLLGAAVPRALGGGMVDPVRAPVGTTLTVLVALAISVLALLPAAWAVGAAWDAARRTLGGEIDAVVVLGAALALAAAWIVALVLAGIAAAGRATLMTAELLRRTPGRGSVAVRDAATPVGPARHALAGPPVG